MFFLLFTVTLDRALNITRALTHTLSFTHTLTLIAASTLTFTLTRNPTLAQIPFPTHMNTAVRIHTPNHIPTHLTLTPSGLLHLTLRCCP